ncbi:MAG: hypothetical protein ACE5JB_04140 [bacterium]
MKPLSRNLKALFIALFILLLSSSLSSQPIWIDQNQTFALEILKPDFDGANNTTLLTSTLFFSVRWPLAEELIFVGELPFAHGELESPESSSEDKLGNPYLGLEIKSEDSRTFLELGLRLPIVSSSNFATFVGSYSDWDRFEAFTSDIVTIMGIVNFRQKNPSNFFLRLRGGPSILFDTEGEEDPILYTVFSGQLGHESEEFTIEGGLTGRLVVSGEGNLGERTFLQLGIAASVGLGQVRPGVHFRLPIEDDLNEVIDFVLGFNLGFQIK